uniref:Uncharacterized protein n=1 Tax=Vespula pensylvanica TaxID=30213 RepID=A0A834N0G1_VESPE|nr:hypothetical protein H0235_017601 [Vespula pensylvanica]
MSFISDVECLIITLSVVQILVSSLEVITIQRTVDSALSQHFKAIGTAFASVWSSVSLEEYTIRSLVMSHHRRSTVHLNCAVIKGKSRAINKHSKKEDLLIDVEEEKEEKADKGEDQGECKDYLSTLAQDLMEDRTYLDDNKEKTENDIENRKDYENGRFNHELQNELIKIEIKLRYVFSSPVPPFERSLVKQYYIGLEKVCDHGH